MRLRRVGNEVSVWLENIENIIKDGRSILGNKIEEKLREFITTNFLFGDTSNQLGDQDSFLEKGIIDSTGVVHLVSFVEETFGITVNDEEILPENFDTIGRLTQFVQKKIGVATGSA